MFTSCVPLNKQGVKEILHNNQKKEKKNTEQFFSFGDLSRTHPYVFNRNTSHYNKLVVDKECKLKFEGD